MVEANNTAWDRFVVVYNGTQYLEYVHAYGKGKGA